MILLMTTWKIVSLVIVGVFVFILAMILGGKLIILAFINMKRKKKDTWNREEHEQKILDEREKKSGS